MPEPIHFFLLIALLALEIWLVLRLRNAVPGRIWLAVTVAFFLAPFGQLYRKGAFRWIILLFVFGAASAALDRRLVWGVPVASAAVIYGRMRRQAARERSNIVFQECVDIYEEAINSYPGKNERDYLQFVLFSKPPFDYQQDVVVEEMLDRFGTIWELARFIGDSVAPGNTRIQNQFFAERRRNLSSIPAIRARNDRFFEWFKKKRPNAGGSAGRPD
jgi:hypothetical protein